jgi:hypothetical protein
MLSVPPVMEIEVRKIADWLINGAPSAADL